MFVNCLAVDFMSMKAMNAGTLGKVRRPVGVVCDSAVTVLWPGRRPRCSSVCVCPSWVGQMAVTRCKKHHDWTDDLSSTRTYVKP